MFFSGYGLPSSRSTGASSAPSRTQVAEEVYTKELTPQPRFGKEPSPLLKLGETKGRKRAAPIEHGEEKSHGSRKALCLYGTGH